MEFQLDSRKILRDRQINPTIVGIHIDVYIYIYTYNMYHKRNARVERDRAIKQQVPTRGPK